VSGEPVGEVGHPQDPDDPLNGPDWWEHVGEPDDVYGTEVAPHVTADTPAEMTAEQAIAARYRLPEEFWGSRELFKRIRQAAWASGNHPDAVLACVLARAAGAAGPEITFDSGKGPATLSLFVCLLAKAGIGKTEAYKAARRLVRLPRALADETGRADQDVFRDGMGISSGEGLAEIYMGTVEKDTGRLKPAKRGQAPEPETVKVRAVVRHRACFFNDEGEALTKLMNERQGSILGPSLRSAWSGSELSQANASEDRYRLVPGDQYTMGVIIGYQPETAVALLSDVGPGTPQRFLWFGAQDVEMPDELYEWPEHVTLPPEDAPAGCIHFPVEIKRWLRRQHVAKHRGEVDVDPMNAHEPLMMCKLSALLAWLDGRMSVTQDDWVLARMIWSVSCAIRDRLIRERDAEAERRAMEKREARLAEVTQVETIKLTVTHDVERVAKRIHAIVAKAVAEPDPEKPKKWKIKQNKMGRDKMLFDPALAHAVRLDWVVESADGMLDLGWSEPR